MSRKVCKKCKIFVKGAECPLCKGNQFSESWQGRLSVLDAERSEIAQKIGIKVKGDYSIKVR